MNDQIYSAFATRLSAFAATEGLQVAWPDVPFTPPDSGLWLEFLFFPNETAAFGIANADASQALGFGQVTCCARPVPGAQVSALALAQDVISEFKKGTQLGPVRVELQPWASSALTASDRLVVPVTIRYSGFVANG